MRRFWPLIMFLVLSGFLYRGLSLDPKQIPSPLVGKPIPEFKLPLLQDENVFISSNDFKGKVSLFNVWATWCVSCRAEHRVLLELANRHKLTIYGLNYKDERAPAQRWLQALGNPYKFNAFDVDGRVGIEWGVYGTPESFLVDHLGMIRYKHIGPISPGDMHNTLLPLIAQLRSEAKAAKT